MSVIEKFRSMEYGPAPEDSKDSLLWLDARKRHAIQILSMAAALEIKDGKLADPKADNVKRLKKYLRAVGVSSKALARHAGEPEQQVRILVKAFARREFLED